MMALRRGSRGRSAAMAGIGTFLSSFLDDLAETRRERKAEGLAQRQETRAMGRETLRQTMERAGPEFQQALRLGSAQVRGAEARATGAEIDLERRQSGELDAAGQLREDELSFRRDELGARRARMAADQKDRDDRDKARQLQETASQTESRHLEEWKKIRIGRRGDMEGIYDAGIERELPGNKTFDHWISTKYKPWYSNQLKGEDGSPGYVDVPVAGETPATPPLGAVGAGAPYGTTGPQPTPNPPPEAPTPAPAAPLGALSFDSTNIGFYARKTAAQLVSAGLHPDEEKALQQMQRDGVDLSK